MNVTELRLIATVIRDHPWAALATQGSEGAEASWVAYVAEADFSGFLLHLSRLAAHTRNLLENPRACLAVSERDQEDRDPQELARVMIQGSVAIIPPETTDYRISANRYQQRLPQAKRLFTFSDFLLLRLIPTSVRFVGGFARAYTLDAGQLQEAATFP
jgi:putative heme iron utilization protein